ncbi:ribonuclease P protein component [Amycolatopsis cynarae]
MLPPAARLRRSEDFREVMRRGSRAGRRRLVVHALWASDEQSVSAVSPPGETPAEVGSSLPTPSPLAGYPAERSTADEPVRPSRAELTARNVRAGFVVSKAVGNSVVRHRVSRRLRHLVAARLGTVPPGSSLVIRALPPAATASSAELGADLDAALRRLSQSPNRRAAGSPEHAHDGSAV